MVSWSIFGAALDWSRNGAAPSSEEVADHALAVIVGGASTLELPQLYSPECVEVAFSEGGLLRRPSWTALANHPLSFPV